MGQILQHKHLIIRAEIKNPPFNVDEMSAWMENMVREIEMDILDGPRTIYSDMVGNRGMTSSVILNTSNACIHTWDEVDPAIMMVDVYSCGHLDPNVIFKLLETFNPVKIEYKYLDREHNLHIMDEGICELSS